MNKYTLYLFTLFIFLSKSLFSEDPASSTTKQESVLETPAIPTPPAPKKSEYAFPIEDVIPPQTKQDDRFFTELLNMLSVLGIVIVVILATAWFLKRILNTRMQQINTISPIKILERRALTPKTTIYLIEINGKGIALAESQNGASLLAEFDNLPPLSESSKEASAFDKILEDKKRQ